MHKTFKYRIYPTNKQTTKLLQTLKICKTLYNNLLEERKSAYEQESKSVSCFDQQKNFCQLKESKPEFKEVHSQVLQNVAIRLDLAFKSFFRRVKQGETPGYPRFRSIHRYDSFTYPQTGFSLVNNKLRLSKIGDIKIVLHRPVKGIIKTCTVKRSPTGKWYVSFSVEIEPVRLEKTGQVVGIDVGLKTFASLSDNFTVENPKFFIKEQKNLAKEQRKREKLTKNSPERSKRRKRIARIHERIKFRRDNFCHQISRKIVNKFDIICVEDLEVNKLLHNCCFAKSIADASWSEFSKRLSDKAEEAGRQFIKVNPAYTTQTCSKCKHRHKLELKDRMFECLCCGLSIDRDYNASLNILAVGLDSLRAKSLEASYL